jgi:hypothetical protein
MVALPQVKSVTLVLIVLCRTPQFQGSLFPTEGRSALKSPREHLGEGRGAGAFVPGKKLERKDQ